MPKSKQTTTKKSKAEKPKSSIDKVKKSNPTYRFVFTYNNYTQEGEDALKEFMSGNCKYGIFGHEVAPTTGTPHLQGYLNLHKKKRTEQLQKDLQAKGINLSLQYAKGNDSANERYCSKDATDIFEVGKPVTKGQRTDLQAVTEVIKTKPLSEIIEEFPEQYIKYPRGIESTKEHYEQEEWGNRIRPVYVTLLYGESGTSKTRDAEMMGRSNGSYYIVSPPNNGQLWFDGYDGQETIIFDDFYGWIKPHDLFRLLDIYSVRLNIKGKTRPAKYINVYITSNFDSTDWYKADVKFDRMALERRIHKRVFYSRNAEGKVERQVLKNEPRRIIEDSVDPEVVSILAPPQETIDVQPTAVERPDNSITEEHSSQDLYDTE